jgi:nucleoside-diphosphate-sugar epimerase
VTRAVFTSSGVTAVPGDPGGPAKETVWAEPSGSPVRKYRDSKILAERDAWDLAAKTGLEVSAVLPTFMQGPMLGAPGRQGSVEVIRRTLAGWVPAMPNIGWDVVDVRDVAELHILAMTSPAAAGQRFLGSGSWLWWSDVARILREKLPGESVKVPTRTMPDFLVKVIGRVNPQMAMLRPDLGRKTLVDSSKARTVLGWHARPAARRSSTPPPRSKPRTRSASSSTRHDGPAVRSHPRGAAWLRARSQQRQCPQPAMASGSRPGKGQASGTEHGSNETRR